MGRLLLCVVLFLYATPLLVFAAEIVLDPAQRQYSWLDTFMVPVRIETGDECINAVSVTVQYDPERLTLIDVGRGSSIITLWTEAPAIDALKGEIRFSGGVPGGYCGRIAGDPGFTNVLAELAFTGARGDALVDQFDTAIGIPRAEVLLHDGLGTPVSVATRGATLTLSNSSVQPQDEWLGTVRADTTAPELFDITLGTDPNISGGHFIVFNTTDKQSGVDHYAVLETDPARFGFLTWTPRAAYWVDAESPYILRDQKLRSKIMVKAIDKAGNERVVEYTPPQPLLAEVTDWRVISLMFLFGLFVLGIWAAWRRGTKSARRILKKKQASVNSYEDS
jgi:hypothetical protein